MQKTLKKKKIIMQTSRNSDTFYVDVKIVVLFYKNVLEMNLLSMR